MTKLFNFPEGATPITDCSGLIPLWVQTMEELNRVEAENILDAQRKYLHNSSGDPKNWFHVKNLKAIHKEMFRNVWEWAGQYRKSITSIGVDPTQIPMQLTEFCFEVTSWSQYPTELTFTEMAARVHHRLVTIHPFENGNGRFSRLVADRFLLSWKCSHSSWPTELSRDGVIRKEYIQALKNADQGDYTSLVHFMKRYGANDPNLSTLLEANLYRPTLQEQRGIALVKALLRNGADPNEKNAAGHHVLHVAKRAGLQDVVNTLIEAGAKGNE